MDTHLVVAMPWIGLWLTGRYVVGVNAVTAFVARKRPHASQAANLGKAVLILVSVFDCGVLGKEHLVRTNRFDCLGLLSRCDGGCRSIIMV